MHFNRMFGLRLSGGFLYGVLLRDNTSRPSVHVVRLKPNGHGLTFLANGALPTPFGAAVPTSVAVDDTFVYFLDEGGITILKTCK